MSSMDWQCWMCDKCRSPLFVCGKAVLVWWYFKGTTCPSGARVLGGFSGLPNIFWRPWREISCWNLVFLSWYCLGGWLLWGTQLGFIPPGSAHGAELSRGVWCSLLSVPKPGWGKGVRHNPGLPWTLGHESFDKAGPCTKILNDSISWLLFIPTC